MNWTKTTARQDNHVNFVIGSPYIRDFMVHIVPGNACCITTSINSLWPSDAKWWHRSGSTLARVMVTGLQWVNTLRSKWLTFCWPHFQMLFSKEYVWISITRFQLTNDLNLSALVQVMAWYWTGTSKTLKYSKFKAYIQCYWNKIINHPHI